MISNCVQCYYYREIIQTLLFMGVDPDLKLFCQNVIDPLDKRKYSTSSVSSLLLYEETSIIDFPYTVLVESFILCNLL